MQIVVSGRLITEMTPENGVLDAEGRRRVIRNDLGPWDMTIFYQGSIHTEFNPECEEAVFVSSFGNDDFGIGQVADQFFAHDSDLVSAVLGDRISGEDIDAVRAAIPRNIARGVDECLARCGIEKRKI